MEEMDLHLLLAESQELMLAAVAGPQLQDREAREELVVVGTEGMQLYFQQMDKPILEAVAAVVAKVQDYQAQAVLEL
jgi:hypothetical protein